MLRFRLSSTAVIALSLDDCAMQACYRERIQHAPGTGQYNLEVTGQRSCYTIVCDEVVAKRLLEDLLDRACNDKIGGFRRWDQPGSWTRACGVGARKVRRAIEKASK